MAELGAHGALVFQGALSERQQILPEVMKNGEDENPLKVSGRCLMGCFMGERGLMDCFMGEIGWVPVLLKLTVTC